VAISLRLLLVRSPTRIRLVYDNTLGGGAFVPSWFSLETLDGGGTNPNVVAALAVPDYPDQAELVLDAELVNGRLYQLDVQAGVPATGGGGTAGASTHQFRPEGRPADPSPSLRLDDVIAELFQVDLLHDGEDFAEEASGDLAGITGPENAKRAAARRILASGLAWRSGYGARSRHFVDAPEPSLPALRGRVSEQLLLDDRIVRSSVSIPAEQDGATPTVDVELEFIGGFRDSLRT
jgi:hypothetical protein